MLKLQKFPLATPDTEHPGSRQLLVLGYIFAEVVVNKAFGFADYQFHSPSAGLKATISPELQNIKVLERWSWPSRLAEKGGID